MVESREVRCWLDCDFKDGCFRGIGGFLVVEYLYFFCDLEDIGIICFETVVELFAACAEDCCDFVKILGVPIDIIVETLDGVQFAMVTCDFIGGLKWRNNLYFKVEMELSK
jgi:hypothetical protein